MQIKGIIKQRTRTESGTSQRTGNQWRTDEYLVVIPGQYEKKINFEVRGVDRCEQWENFVNGMPDKNAPVLIQFEINAREHEGRWFNSVEAWDIAITTW
jgi:hypothetical protein